MNRILEEVLRNGYVYLKRVGTDTLEFAEKLGTVFQPFQSESPIINLKIEGNDSIATPYASCRTPELSIHTDYATFTDPPRFTISHCIEPDPDFPKKGLSVVLFLDPVYEYLQKNEPLIYKTLFDPIFPFRRNTEHEVYHDHIPRFAIIDQMMQVRFDRTLIEPHLNLSNNPNDLLLKDAVAIFEDACLTYAKRVEITLDRSDVLIISNRKVLHTRSECSTKMIGNQLISREVNLVFLI